VLSFFVFLFVFFSQVSHRANFLSDRCLFSISIGCSMNHSYGLAVYLKFRKFFLIFIFYGLLYSPLALLGTLFSSFFRVTPILSHLPIYPCDPLPSSYFFRTNLVFPILTSFSCCISDYHSHFLFNRGLYISFYIQSHYHYLQLTN
jgi:hypothetical protein